MAKIRAIVKRTDEPVGHVTNISNTLKNLQKIVDGNIETVRITDGCILLCNEEGMILGLPHNLIVGRPPLHHSVVGDVVVVGVDGEEFCDCPLDFSTWKWLLKEWGN
jgi:hypothetical protein